METLEHLSRKQMSQVGDFLKLEATLQPLKTIFQQFKMK